MFCISLGSVSYPDPSPCTAPGLRLLPLSGFHGQETISANAIQNSHCVPALCSSTHLLPAMFGADSRTTQESLFIQTLCCTSLLLPISYFCELLINKQVGITYMEHIWLSLYYAQGENHFSALFLHKQKYTESRQNT